MLKIRFQRRGRRNEAQFRIVVTQDYKGPKGGALEVLGFYNPKLKTHGIDKERVQYWIGKGAQTSRTIHNLLVRIGVLTGKKIPVPMRAESKGETPASGTTAEAAPAETPTSAQ